MDARKATTMSIRQHLEHSLHAIAIVVPKLITRVINPRRRTRMERAARLHARLIIMSRAVIVTLATVIFHNDFQP